MAKQTSTYDRAVLSALRASEQPLSAYDILERVRNSGIRAPMQVYRSLDRLASMGAVHRIEALNAFVACREDQYGHKPGFVICRDCGTVKEFEDGRLDAIAHRAAGKDFAIDEVSVEVLGQCVDCRGKA
ncbi:MAG TPA: Fur family transcriptional regulator [Aestuariivirgaceae bacterium]|jgi:Fur family zinc uptake transcriptional regulator